MRRLFKIPGLVRAMHQQIYKEDVLDVHQHNSWLKSIYKGNTYRSTAPVNSG